MKLQQLRYIWEVARHDLNVSATAQSLFTSQPGISKQVRLLEDELGVEIFERSGKHLTRVTPAGEAILERAGDILRKVESIKQVAQEFRNDQKGTLSIATTHTQARYALPPAIKVFMERYPEVSLHMHQGTPVQISEMAADGTVDFAIATEALELFSDLVMMPCYTWNRCVIVPEGHPLASVKRLTIEDVAALPDRDLRVRLHGALASRRGLPRQAPDAARGVHGHRCRRDQDLRSPRARHRDHRAHGDRRAARQRTGDAGCQPPVQSQRHQDRFSRRGTFLRGYMYEFIELFAPHLTREVVDKAWQLQGKAEVEALFEGVELPTY
jgi:LysR family cys regulon transcriptional activator